MRKRWAFTLAANGRWPTNLDGAVGFPFNWVKIDNRGSNSVDFGFSSKPTAGDHIDTYGTVSAGKCRVFNVSGPLKGAPDPENSGENEVNQVYLVSTAGTDIVLEVADHPIVDMTFPT